MADYIVTTVQPSDERLMKAVHELLRQEGLRPEKNPDLVCAAVSESGDVIATGALHGSTLRCMAVSSASRGEGLMNSVVSFLVQEAFAQGRSHLFLCTKYDTARFFRDVGFYEIVSVPGQIVFLENKRAGFSDYLSRLSTESARKTPAPEGPVSAIVLNANPFTNGHLALIEQAARESALLHLFVVSEDASFFPHAVRRRLIEEGCEHLNNILIHDSGAYLLSDATFPSYFQKDGDAVVRSHAHLDAAVFLRIAKHLGITRRYVGEEEASNTTRIYNTILRKVLPEGSVELSEIPRKCENGRPISASFVRSLIHDDHMLHEKDPQAPLSDECLRKLQPLLPASTFSYLQSKEACPVLSAIRLSDSVIHH